MSRPRDGRADEIIVSTANPLIKYIRSLQRRKTRYQERAYVVEGVRAVDEALHAGVELLHVLVRDDIALHTLSPALLEAPLRRASDAAFRTVTNVEYPQGILAVVAMPTEHDITLDRSTETLILVADGIRDPGNLGTLLRSAAGAGADLTATADASVDPYNPKVVRAAMGAHFRLPIVQAAPEALSRYLEPLSQVVIAEADGEEEYDQIDLTLPTAIVVGGEAFGPLGHLDHPNTLTVRIPLARTVESLNAGVAGSLLLFEAARQRRRGLAARG